MGGGGRMNPCKIKGEQCKFGHCFSLVRETPIKIGADSCIGVYTHEIGGRMNPYKIKVSAPFFSKVFCKACVGTYV